MYLSSYRLGDHPEYLARLIDGPRSIGVIANALDHSTEPARVAEGIAREMADLRALGLRPVELDLRAYFRRTTELRRRVEELQAVWVRGGNTFVLRRALAESEADALLVELVRSGRLVYAGYSAGICVLAPSLEGLEMIDDPDAVARTYGSTPLWNGLALLPELVLPHFESDHPESAAVGRAHRELSARGVKTRTLRDGQAILIEGDTVSVV